MSKSTRVIVKVPGAELAYDGLAGKKLLSNPLFYIQAGWPDHVTGVEVLEEVGGDHDVITAYFLGQHANDLMSKDGFIPMMTSITGLTNTAHACGLLNEAFERETYQTTEQTSITFEVYS